MERRIAWLFVEVCSVRDLREEGQHAIFMLERLTGPRSTGRGRVQVGQCPSWHHFLLCETLLEEAKRASERPCMRYCMLCCTNAATTGHSRLALFRERRIQDLTRGHTKTYPRLCSLLYRLQCVPWRGASNISYTSSAKCPKQESL